MIILTLGKKSFPAFVVDQEEYVKDFCTKLTSDFGYICSYQRDSSITGFNVNFRMENARLSLKTADKILNRMKSAFIAQ